EYLKTVECLVQQDPQLRARAGSRRAWSTPTDDANAVSQIVQRNHQQSENDDDRLRQMNERGEHDHRHADNPDDLEETEEAIVRMKRDEPLNDCHLEHDQPQPARYQKPRQLRLALAAHELQV